MRLSLSLNLIFVYVTIFLDYFFTVLALIMGNSMSHASSRDQNSNNNKGGGGLNNYSLPLVHTAAATGSTGYVGIGMEDCADSPDMRRGGWFKQKPNESK